jgi:hypothetical protein
LTVSNTSGAPAGVDCACCDTRRSSAFNIGWNSAVFGIGAGAPHELRGAVRRRRAALA